jgi:hypothetical protein
MTLDSFIRYGSLWTLILGVLSLAFAVRNYRRQVNAQIFVEIAGRYQDLLQSFPVQQWVTRLNSKEELPMSTPEVTSGVLRYMATVHFAFILHDLRYLSKGPLETSPGRTLSHTDGSLIYAGVEHLPR